MLSGLFIYFSLFQFDQQGDEKFTLNKVIRNFCEQHSKLNGERCSKIKCNGDLFFWPSTKPHNVCLQCRCKILRNPERKTPHSVLDLGKIAQK